MASIFTKIITGEIPSYKIAENHEFYAFLDVNPMVKGHTLIVPKQEIDYIFDMNDELLQRMIVFAKKVARGMQTAIKCTRVGMMVIGLEVPHAHIHLIPIEKEGDMSVGKPKLKLSSEEMAQIAENICSALK